MGEESCIYINYWNYFLVLVRRKAVDSQSKGPASTDPELNFYRNRLLKRILSVIFVIF